MGSAHTDDGLGPCCAPGTRPDRAEGQSRLWCRGSYGCIMHSDLLTSSTMARVILDTAAFEVALNASIAVSITDADGVIEYANERFCKTSGYSLDELIGQNHRMSKSGSHTEEFFSDLFRAITNGTTWTGQICNRAKDGAHYWLDTVITPIIRPDGVIDHYVSFGVNITNRIHVETSLSEAKNAAEAANTAKSRFLAMMSHEIRTPLNGIMGMAQMLMTPKLPNTSRVEYAGAVLDAGTVLSRLLDDILYLSKIEAGRMDLVYSEFSPWALAGEVVYLFSVAAAGKKLRLETVWNGPTDRRYMADTLRLRQMLTNLVDNAIKFTDFGTIEVSISESSRVDNRATLEFSVRDTGAGILSEDLTKLFQPFSQHFGNSPAVPRGAGLGLSIVRQLAELMNGSVGVDSAPGRGSRFWFHIEAEQVISSALVPVIELYQPMGAHEGAKRGLALVVEDDLMSRRVIEAMLTHLGLEIVIAENGQVALDKLTDSKFHPDIVFMDCRMPVMDGFSATQRFRLWERRRGSTRLPIIALTAGAFEEDRVSSKAVGMDDFISKPVFMNDLNSVIDRYLSHP